MVYKIIRVSYYLVNVFKDKDLNCDVIKSYFKNVCGIPTKDIIKIFYLEDNIFCVKYNGWGVGDVVEF